MAALVIPPLQVELNSHILRFSARKWESEKATRTQNLKIHLPLRNLIYYTPGRRLQNKFWRKIPNTLEGNDILQLEAQTLTVQMCKTIEMG